MNLDNACEHYDGPDWLKKRKVEMEKRARYEVTLLSEFQIRTTDGLIVPVGQNILTALKQNLLQGDGQGVDFRIAGPTVTPREVTKWMRGEYGQPVIWHVVDEKFRFASKLHADVALEVLP